MSRLHACLIALVLLCFAASVAVAAGSRPPRPGTLILTMIIKNEAEHLRRTLPKWAKIADYWLIGVDDENTDESPEVIKQYLGHLPGEIVIVKFDGMGPTWQQVVEVGIKKYPEGTHGILADADFMPLQDKMDKWQLDVRCSKHMFTIWTQDHKNERKMDWIYRNIPGAKVARRTHQTLEVPALPNQEVFQTMIDLAIEEREGGYGDRSGKKAERYINMLELDLIDYPNDPRTLYYLGYAHYDVFMRNKDEPRPSDWDMLKKAVEYFKRRTEVNGNMEEGWFANAKLGEIHERFYRDWDKARHYYERCIKDDPERADPHFYIGQYYRLRGQHKEAIPFLKKAAMMPIPDRSLFQWHYLYNCLGHVELGRAVLGLGKDDLPASELKELKTVIADSDCSQGASMGDAQEIKQIVGSLDMRLSSLSGKAGSERVSAAKKVVSLIGKNLNTLEDSLPQDLFNSIVELASRLQDFVAANKGTNPTCRTTRLATTPYLRFLHKHGEEIQDAIDDPTFWASWDALNRVVEVTCR